MTASAAPLDATALAAGDNDLVRACWDGLALIDAGWRLHRLTYRAADRVAVLVVETPSGRVVTLTHTADGVSRDVTMLGLPAGPCARLAVRLAATIALLGQRSGQALEQLGWYLTAHSKRRRSRFVIRLLGQVAIPDPDLLKQPRTLRMAFWLLAALVCESGWLVTDLGSDIAGGGFVADIPGEITAIFPANMARDGSYGAELACLIGGLSPAALDYLQRHNVHTLTQAWTQVQGRRS